MITDDFVMYPLAYQSRLNGNPDLRPGPVHDALHHDCGGVHVGGAERPLYADIVVSG